MFRQDNIYKTLRTENSVLFDKWPGDHYGRQAVV